MATTGKPPTQKDVARLAGVSQGVVSAVLGKTAGTSTVSSEIVTRVHEAALHLNYRPNLSARSMRHGRFFNIGYFVANQDYSDFDFAHFRSGIYDTASENGYNLMMIRMPAKPGMERDVVPKIFRESHLDGIIINPHSVSITEIKELVGPSNKLPIVYLNAKEQFDSVYVDDYTGGKLATEHLYGQGMRSIAYFHAQSPRLPFHYSMKERIEGYTSFMAEQGLVAQIKNINLDFCTGEIPRDFPKAIDIRTGELLTDWLDDRNRPEGVVCYNDIDAMILMQIMSHLKLRVPDNLAVIGYNNEWWCPFTVSPLSSIQIPQYEMAVAATNKLIAMINAGADRQLTPSIKFTPKVFIRNSSCPGGVVPDIIPSSSASLS